MTDSDGEIIIKRVLSTKEDLEAYRKELHADVASRNPDRDFEILFGNNGGGEMGFVQIWLDGKGPLL